VAEDLAAVVPVLPMARRVVVVVVAAPGRLTAGLVSGAVLAGASGEVAGSEGAEALSAEGVAGASSGCVAGLFSISDMARDGVGEATTVGQSQARGKSVSVCFSYNGQRNSNEDIQREPWLESTKSGTRAMSGMSQLTAQN
jgi:hypothetical protein